MDRQGRDSTPASKKLKFSDGEVQLSTQLKPASSGQVLTSVDTDEANWQSPPASEIHSSSGLIKGGRLAVSAPSSITIEGLIAVITDHSTPISTATTFTWGTLGIPSAPIAITNIASHNITFISIDKNGAITQSTSKHTNADTRDEVLLGVAVHIDRVNVTLVNQEQHTCLDPANMTHDLMKMIGFMNEGNVVVGQSGLTIAKEIGYMFGFGLNFDNDPKDPHMLTLPAITPPMSFQYRYTDGTSETEGTAFDPDNLDDLAGGLTALANNKWSASHIYIFTSNDIKIQRGQKSYNSRQDAIDGIVNDSFIVEPSIIANGMQIGYIICQKGAVGMDDPATCVILAAGKFAGSAGQVSSVQGPTTEMATTGLSINVGNSAPPVTSDILVATSATTATWQKHDLHSAYLHSDLGDRRITVGANDPLRLRVVNNSHELFALENTTGTVIGVFDGIGNFSHEGDLVSGPVGDRTLDADATTGITTVKELYRNYATSFFSDPTPSVGTAPTADTATNTDDWLKINYTGAVCDASAQGHFSVSTEGLIACTATFPKLYRVDASVSAKCDAASTVTWGIAKNPSTDYPTVLPEIDIIPCTAVTMRFATTGNTYAVTMSCVISLTLNDNLAIALHKNGTSQDVTILKVLLMVTEL